MRCPHCQTAFKTSIEIKPLDQDKKGVWVVCYYVCPACDSFVASLTLMDKRFGEQDLYNVLTGEKPINWQAVRPLSDFVIYPRGSKRPPSPPEVPADFAEDYNEACMVLDLSPKASAALGRRVLQHILREKAGVKPGSLANEIQEVLVKGGLPSFIAENVDAIRNVGNFAAHPMKSQTTGEIMPVEPGEAEWILDVLTQLFDFYFVQPAKAKKLRDDLNQKLQDSGKPPMKQLNP